jgi:hypothetical protein
MLDPTISNIALGEKNICHFIFNKANWWKKYLWRKYLAGDRIRFLDYPERGGAQSPTWKLIKSSLPLF